VKDADRLWRLTSPGINIHHTCFGIAQDSYLDWLGTMIDRWLFTSKAKDMAHEALHEAGLEPMQKAD